MKLYTINATPIRTENSKDQNDSLMACYPSVLHKILANYGIDGFTMYEVIGYWKGVGERSYKIEIARPESESDGIMYEICEKLRDKYDQDSVMLTYPNNTVEFI